MVVTSNRPPFMSFGSAPRAARVIPVWSPPDPDEPTSELYRLMPPRRQGDDAGPVVLISPDLQRWRTLAAKARPASRRALAWAWGLATLTLAGVLSLVIYASLPGH
jgi:hypothetical protein